MKTICLYCKAADGKESKYHPGTCAHCGAPVETIKGFYYGKPVTDADEWDRMINEPGILHLDVHLESLL